jgi:hypothetical protein
MQPSILRRGLTHALFSVAMGAAGIGAASVHAACGGGGGGITAVQYYPTWSSPSEATAKAANGSGMVVYALQGDKVDITMWDQNLAALSKTVPFVELKASTADGFMRRWGIESRPAIAIGDQHGNILWSASTSLSPQKVQQAIQALPSAKNTLSEQLERQVAAARKDIANDKISPALQKLTKVLAYKGYQPAIDAQALYDDLVAKGQASLQANQDLAKSDAGQAKQNIRNLSSQYRNTPVADQAMLALKQIK